jgi:ABC-2 type transport system ATP-binding protein
MPDNFGVYDGMKVWEFLDFFAVAYQVPRARRKAVLTDVLELLDLTHKRDDFVNGLSRGMKQRLCLAKTLVHDPPVLILDEPSSGLDPRARLEVKALLKELRKMGKTILISSHILTELADCCPCTLSPATRRTVPTTPSSDNTGMLGLMPGAAVSSVTRATRK